MGAAFSRRRAERGNEETCAPHPESVKPPKPRAGAFGVAAAPRLCVNLREKLTGRALARRGMEGERVPSGPSQHITALGATRTAVASDVLVRVLVRGQEAQTNNAVTKRASMPARATHSAAETVRLPSAGVLPAAGALCAVDVRSVSYLTKKVEDLEREMDECIEASLMSDDAAIGARMLLRSAEAGLRRYGREAEELRNELRRINDVMGMRLREMGLWRLLYECGLGMLVSPTSAAAMRAWLHMANPDRNECEVETDAEKSSQQSHRTSRGLLAHGDGNAPADSSSEDIDSDMDPIDDRHASYIAQRKSTLADSRNTYAGGSENGGTKSGSEPDAFQTPGEQQTRLSELQELPLMQKLRAMRAKKSGANNDEAPLEEALSVRRTGERGRSRRCAQQANSEQLGRNRGKARVRRDRDIERRTERGGGKEGYRDRRHEGERERSRERSRSRDPGATLHSSRSHNGEDDDSETPRAAALRGEIVRMRKAKGQASSKEAALMEKLNALQRGRDESERRARELARKVKEVNQERSVWEREGKVAAERAQVALTARESARKYATGTVSEAFNLQAAADSARVGQNTAAGHAAFAEAQKSTNEWERDTAVRVSRSRRLSSGGNDSAGAGGGTNARPSTSSGTSCKRHRRRSGSFPVQRAPASESDVTSAKSMGSVRQGLKAAAPSPSSSECSSRIGGSESTRTDGTFKGAPTMMGRLFSAARHGREEELAALLVEGGASAAAVRDRFQNTPLIVAAQNNRKHACRAALRGGVHIDAVNKQGNTALHYAFAYAYFEVADYLISRGADTSLTNAVGQTPIEAGGGTSGPLAKLVEDVRKGVE